MKRILIAPRVLRILTGISLTLLLHASSNAPGATASAAARSRPNNSLIRIWIVGSPHTNALPEAVIPPELRQRAESLGFDITIQAFRPTGFAAHFHEALQNHTEPEVLTFDNYGVLMGLQTRLGWFQGVDWDRRTASSLALVHETMTSLQPRGWVMLVTSAVNYEAARALAMRPAECDTHSGPAQDPSTMETALRLAREKAVFATRAYLDCNRSTLAAVSDESRLVQQCFQPQSETKIASVKACSVSGNNKLAFVSLVSGFSSVVRDRRGALVASKAGMDLGQKSILAVLSNQSGTWRLLAITHDVVNTVARRHKTTNILSGSLDRGPHVGIRPEPARLLTPNGVYPVPQPGERFGDLLWFPSQSTDVIGQVVEFAWGKDTNWGQTRLFFLPASENKISVGLLMDSGPTVWRIWSVNKSGDVAFSEQHAFRQCPVPSVCR